MEFKERFKNFLEDYEITAKNLGDQLGIDHSSIYLYLQGSLPNIENAVKLANYFNCSLNYLFGLDAYPDEYRFNKTFEISSFFRKYKNILQEKGLTHYRVSKDLGLGNSSFQKWKSGSAPKIETLIKLSKYFDCPVDFFCR